MPRLTVTWPSSQMKFWVPSTLNFIHFIKLALSIALFILLNLPSVLPWFM